MERKQIYITKKQKQELKKQSEENGLSVSEIIRRAIDNYLERGK